MKMYEYRYNREDGLVSLSIPVLEEWENEERFLHQWYRVIFDWRKYGRWSFGFTLKKFYRVLPDDKEAWYTQEWEGFYLFGTYIPFLKAAFCFSLMRLEPRLKIYPKKKYRDVVSEHRMSCEGISGCHRDANCAICGEGTGYLPQSWIEYGVRWEADFCKDHDRFDIWCEPDDRP